MARGKSALLTDKQKALVDAKMQGMSDSAALQEVYNTKNMAPIRTEEVQEAIKEAREEIKNASTLTRLDIIEGILDSIQMARQMSEPSTMIAGYDKLAKIVGAYEPQKVVLELSDSAEKVLRKMEMLTREELLMISEGKALVVDGEFTRVC